MEKSFFSDYVKKYFPTLVLRTVERMNGDPESLIPSYWFKRLLTTTYSVDGRWSALLGEYGRVAADFVALDSSLPIKRRDSLEKVSGEIPKLGMEMNLNEKQMKDIRIMISMNLPEEEIIAKILNDVPRVIEGIYERNELTFLQGLSTGVAELFPYSADVDNVGTSIRLDYGFKPENQFGVEALDLSKIIDDLRRLEDKARNEDGNVLKHAYMKRSTFQKIIQSPQFKEYFAFGKGFVGSNVTIPTFEQANSVFSEQFGFTVSFTDRVMNTERNGKRTVINPWKDGMITITAEENIGNLVWTDLAEAGSPVAGVNYQTADGYILVSKYSTVRPSFAEFTTSQAMALPIISKVDKIYQLDTNTIQA